jgi:DNA integrity scanning protein DisA with diadenylate cyclase activity
VFKDRLAELDSASKEKHEGQLDEQYKEIRQEMVKVIQDISSSTQKVTQTIQTLYKFREELQKNIKILDETKYHLEVAKRYLSQLLFLVYKMEREIYTET